MASTRNSQCHRRDDVDQSRHISRSGIVHGPLSSAVQAGGRRDDMWFDIDRFQLDHLNEVLEKLQAGGIDDEIWGKIICMERGKRIAKAYLRKTTIIVDGSCEDFDGKTLGFNHFSNPFRDEQTEEMRTKIADGVIIKMDHHGNVKAMARGSSPVYIQGWRDSRNNCISERVVKSQGKLINIGPTHTPITDEERVVKIFDMRKFKSAVEHEMAQSAAKGKELLLKTCIRVALVKDGGSSDPMKTPCWFMIINLVALDMLKSKLPAVLSSPLLRAPATPAMQRQQHCRHASADDLNAMGLASSKTQQMMIPAIAPSASSDLLSNPHALTQIIAAAMKQANYQPQPPPPPTIHIPTPEQLAHIASTLALGSMRSSPQSAYGSIGSLSSSSSPRRGTGSKSQHRRSGSTIRDGGGRWDSMARSIDALYEPNEDGDGDDFPDPLPPPTPSSRPIKNKNFSMRPKLSEALFHAPPTARKSTTNWSCQSITSDYDRDSNKDLYDSTGSWSSGSRGSSTNSNPEARSSSPSVLSEAASESQTSDFHEEMRQMRRSSSTVPEQAHRNSKALYEDGDSLGYVSDMNYASVGRTTTRNRTLLKRNRPLMPKSSVVAVNKRLNGMLDERYAQPGRGRDRSIHNSAITNYQHSHISFAQSSSFSEETDSQSDDGAAASPTSARRSTSPPMPQVVSHLYPRQLSSSAIRLVPHLSCSSQPVPPFRKKRTSPQASPVSVGGSAEPSIVADQRHVTTLTLDCDDTNPGTFTRLNRTSNTEIWSF